MNDLYFWAFSGALLFLGILIALGNERQRRAIDGVRKSAVEWANRDLHIKRGQISSEIKIGNINQWIDRVILQAQGTSPEIFNIDTWNLDDIHTIIAFGRDNNKYILSPIPATQIRKAEIKASQQSKVGALKSTLLGKNPRNYQTKELTIVNAGVFFDLEVQKIWEHHFQKKLLVEKMYLIFQKSSND